MPYDLIGYCKWCKWWDFVGFSGIIQLPIWYCKQRGSMGNSWPCTVGEQQMLPKWLRLERPWLLLLSTLVCSVCVLWHFWWVQQSWWSWRLVQGPEMRLVLALGQKKGFKFFVKSGVTCFVSNIFSLFILFAVCLCFLCSSFLCSQNVVIWTWISMSTMWNMLDGWWR